MSKPQLKTLRLLCQELTEDDAQEVVAYWLAYTDRNPQLLEEAADAIDQSAAARLVDET